MVADDQDTLPGRLKVIQMEVSCVVCSQHKRGSERGFSFLCLLLTLSKLTLFIDSIFSSNANLEGRSDANITNEKIRYTSREVAAVL